MKVVRNSLIDNVMYTIYDRKGNHGHCAQVSSEICAKKQLPVDIVLVTKETCQNAFNSVLISDSKKYIN